MAWTTPRTWANGEVESAPTFNTHIQDNLNWLKGHTGNKVFWFPATVMGGISWGPLSEFVDFTYGYPYAGVVSSVPDTAYISGQIGNSVTSLIAAQLIYTSGYTNNQTFSVDTSYGAVGETSSTHASSGNYTISYTAGKLGSVDVSARFSSMAAGDAFGLKAYAATFQGMGVIGLYMEWN